MKHVSILLLAIGFISSSAFSQFKLHSNGSVSMGSTTLLNTAYNLTLGETYGNRYGILHKKGTQTLRMGQASYNDAVIGSTCRKIAFWYSSTYAYNDLYASSYNQASDRRLKTNLDEIKTTDAIDVLMKLKAYSFKYKSDLNELGDQAKLNYGFIAQEVREILPDITDTLRGVMLMDYNQITPFLVSGFKELNNTNKSLRSKIDSLNKKLGELESLIKLNGVSSSESGKDHETGNKFSRLYQNTPNPFNEKTTIKYEVDKVFNSAQIVIFDMNGKIIKTIDLDNSNSNGAIVIKSGELYAGMFMYSLIVDDRLVDTKKMILTK